MAVTHITGSVVTNSTYKGTNTKLVFNFIKEMLGDDIEIIKVATNNTNIYDVYFKLVGCDDIVYRIYNTNNSTTYNYFWMEAYYKDSAGSVTIANDKYTLVASTQTSAFITSSNARVDVHIIKEPGSFYGIFVGSIAHCGYVWLVDVCSNEERCIALYRDLGTSSGSTSHIGYSMVDGTKVVHNLWRTYPNTPNNGYTHMTPVVCYTPEFIGHLKNPVLLYSGSAGGGALTMPEFVDFSVGGIKFMSLESGFAIRLDD